MIREVQLEHLTILEQDFVWKVIIAATILSFVTTFLATNLSARNVRLHVSDWPTQCLTA